MPDTHPNEARRLGKMLRMQVRAMCQVSSTEGVNAAVANSLLRSEFIAAVDALVALAEQAPGGEPMEMCLCEASKLVLRIGQPYVFKECDGCESCKAAGDAARKAYGPSGGFTSPAKVGPAEGWVSVENRLPEDGQSVAFVVACKDPSFDYLDGKVLGGYYRASPFGGFGVPGLTIGASHWMPLAAAPHAGEGK